MATFDILAVLQEHGLDRVPSRDYGEATIRCPYHDDRRPSARVNLDKGLFYCHTCGVAGDAISLKQHHEGLTYQQAVDSLGGDTATLPKRDTIQDLF